MSLKLTDAVWNCACLSSYRKLVLLAFINHADKNNECYPSLELISKLCGISLRMVNKVTSSLIKSGILTAKRRHDPRGHKVSNLYKIDRAIIESLSAHGAPRLPVDKSILRAKKMKSLSAHGAPRRGGYSLSVELEDNKKRKKIKKRKKELSKKIALPIDFSFNQSHVALANELKLNLDYEFKHFLDRSRASGKKFADWDAAFSSALRAKNNFLITSFKLQDFNHAKQQIFDAATRIDPSEHVPF